jgi:hypothetical protein
VWFVSLENSSRCLAVALHKTRPASSEVKYGDGDRGRSKYSSEINPVRISDYGAADRSEDGTHT